MNEIAHIFLVKAGAAGVLVVLLGLLVYSSYAFSRFFRKIEERKIKLKLQSNPNACLKCGTKNASLECNSCGWNKNAYISQKLSNATEKGKSFFYGVLCLILIFLLVIGIVLYNASKGSY